MLHPDCKVEKKDHFLEDCPEWVTFSEVRHIFASTALRWSIADVDVSSTTGTEEHTTDDGSLEHTQRLIALQNAFDFFKVELQTLPSSAPDRDIECGPFDRCQKKLAKLLDLLDTFVQDSVLVASEPPALPGFSWMRGILPKKPVNEVRCEKFAKLKALGKLARDGDDLDEFPPACKPHLRLGLNAQECIQALETIRDFNLFFESSKISGTSNPKDASYPLSFPTTNWRDNTASDTLGRLFNVLCRRSEDTSCMRTKGTWKRHETMLRLCGSQLDERPLAFSVFFRFCDTPGSWQPIHLMPKDPNDFTRREDIYDLCSYARNYHQDEIVNNYVPSLFFHDDQLRVNIPSNPPIRPDAWPARSFRQLIRENVIRDRFEDGDKAVLALSVARCLLNIPRFHSSGDSNPWADLLLTSDSVQFLHRESTSEILDVHHPYVHYFTCQNQHYQEDGETRADRYRTTLVSLARFLLEIHLGRELNMEFSPSTNIDDTKNKLFDIVDAEKLNYTRKHYLDAVRGCLNFRASLKSELRVQRQQEKPGDLVRKVICTTVVQPLERNLSVVNKYQHYLTQRNLRLVGLAHQSVYPDVGTSIGNHSRPRRRSTVRSAPPRHSSTGLRESDKGIMFDGRVAADKDISEAVTFLDNLDQFYTGHIKEKAKARRKSGKRRIRIAVLDTGIDETDSFISGKVDDIMAERYKQYKEQERAKKNERQSTTRQRLLRLKDFSPIAGKWNFVDKKQDVPDSTSHGTHVVGLLLSVAPEADIYVAKISNALQFEDPSPVVEAIKWATEEPQGVDIISMSFGMQKYNSEIAGAIIDARKARKIMFAAASNGGRNTPRTYPGSDSNVICVHALTGLGETGSINPSSRNEHDRLATLGMGLTLHWGDKEEFKDGTSYATPIAAGIAANWLEWINATAEAGQSATSLKQEELDHWTQYDGMSKIFSKVMSVDSAGGSGLRYVAPWHLWAPGEEATDDQIIGNIRRDLSKA